jgi:hypothetical protein
MKQHRGCCKAFFATSSQSVIGCVRSSETLSGCFCLMMPVWAATLRTCDAKWLLAGSHVFVLGLNPKLGPTRSPAGIAPDGRHRGTIDTHIYAKHTMNLHTRLQGYCSSTPPHPSIHRMPGSVHLGAAASTAKACAPRPGTRLLRKVSTLPDQILIWPQKSTTGVAPVLTQRIPLLVQMVIPRSVPSSSEGRLTISDGILSISAHPPGPKGTISQPRGCLRRKRYDPLERNIDGSSVPRLLGPCQHIQTRGAPGEHPRAQHCNAKVRLAGSHV